MKELKEATLLAVVIVGLLMVGVWSSSPPLAVTHQYEDGCIDVFDRDIREYKFYCEEEF